MKKKKTGRKPEYLAILSEILRLLRAGKSYREIEKELPVSKSVVGVIAKRHKIKV